MTARKKFPTSCQPKFSEPAGERFFRYRRRYYGTPPHNLTEVINGCLAYIDDEDISIEGLMEHIPGRTSRRRQSLTVVAVLRSLPYRSRQGVYPRSRRSGS
ncbi:hypothetical protein ACLB1S_20690 [Escherichia coli]